MQSDALYKAARRSYELGRLSTSAWRAAFATIVVGVLGALLLGRGALVWLPMTFGSVLLTEHLGGALMRGARRGLLAGLSSMLLPLSVLRPCCANMDAKMMGESCCTMPSACWSAGAIVGLGMALLLPKEKHALAAAGMLMGVFAVAVLRCSSLFWGETLGLLGGLAAGVAATSLARAALERRWSALE